MDPERVGHFLAPIRHTRQIFRVAVAVEDREALAWRLVGDGPLARLDVAGGDLLALRRVEPDEVVAPQQLLVVEREGEPRHAASSTFAKIYTRRHTINRMWA